MPSFAEMLTGAALEESTKDPGYGESLNKGAELGLAVQKAQTERAELEQKKQELQNMKHQTFTDDLAKAKGMSGKKLQGYLKFLKAKRDHLGLTEIYNDDTLDFITATPDNMGRFVALKGQVRDGQLTLDQALEKIEDKSQFLDVTPDMLSDLYKAAEGKIDAKEAQSRADAAAKAAMNRTEFSADASAKRAEEARKDAGNVEYSKQLSKSYKQYKLEGGRGTIKTNFDRLQDAKKALEGGKVQTGKGFTKWIGGSDFALDIVDPEVAKARDRIRSAIVGTLRPILGGQFAEKEGQRILDLSFNPRLSSDENAKRVAQELDGIKQRVIDKEKEFVKHGRMSPDDMTFKSRAKGDIKLTAKQKESFPKLSAEEQKKFLEGAAKKFDTTVEKIKKTLEN